MNRLKVRTLLSGTEQLQNTGPLMSRGLVFDVQEFRKFEINMPNEYLFVLNSKVYACSDPILANFSSIS